MDEPWHVPTVAQYIRECFLVVVVPSEPRAITSKMKRIHGKINEQRLLVEPQRDISSGVSAAVVQRDHNSADTVVFWNCIYFTCCLQLGV